MKAGSFHIYLVWVVYSSSFQMSELYLKSRSVSDDRQRVPTPTRAAGSAACNVCKGRMVLVPYHCYYVVCVWLLGRRGTTPCCFTECSFQVSFPLADAPVMMTQRIACNLALACLVVALLGWRPSNDTGQRVQLHTTAEEVPEGFAVTVRTCHDGYGQPTVGYPEYPDGFAWDTCSPKPAPTRAWFRRRLAADAPLERCMDVVERCKRKSSDGAGGASPAQRQRT